MVHRAPASRGREPRSSDLPPRGRSGCRPGNPMVERVLRNRRQPTLRLPSPERRRRCPCSAVHCRSAEPFRSLAMTSRARCVGRCRRQSSLWQDRRRGLHVSACRRTRRHQRALPNRAARRTADVSARSPAPPAIAYAIETPHSGRPRRKLLVPSIGSTIQHRSPASPPLSSARKPSVGKASARRVRIKDSTSRSAILTKSCGPLVSRVRASRWAKCLAASCPASRISWVAKVRRASIVMGCRSASGCSAITRGSAISHLKPWRAPSRDRCAPRPSDASVPSSTAPASTARC